VADGGVNGDGDRRTEKHIVAARVGGPDSAETDEVETKDEITLYAADIDEGRE
jgi:hypothetical protein